MLVLNLMCCYFVEALEEFQFRARMIERNTSSTINSRGALVLRLLCELDRIIVTKSPRDTKKFNGSLETDLEFAIPQK